MATTTRAGPPIPPVLHRSLLTGQLILTGVMVVLRSGDTGVQLSDDNQMLGYGLSAACRLLVPAAGSAWPVIAGILALDRMGKGIRTAPRDRATP